MGTDTHRADQSQFDSQGQTAGESMTHKSVSLRCRGCEYVLVAFSVSSAEGLGWRDIDVTNHLGMCADCAGRA